MSYFGSFDANTRMKIRAAIVLQLQDILPNYKLEPTRYEILDTYAPNGGTGTSIDSDDPFILREVEASNITDSKDVNIGPVPSQLVAMISTFTKAEFQKEGIYRVAGKAENIKKLQKKPVSAWGDPPVEERTSVTKGWVRNINGGLIHFDTMGAFSKIVDMYRSDPAVMGQKIIKALLLLPVPHLNALRYICLHLSEVASFSDQNKMDLKNLATCWGPTLYPFNEAATQEEYAAIPRLNTSVVDMIRLADTIGMVSGELLEASKAPEVENVFKIVKDGETEPTYILPRRLRTSKSKSVRAAIFSSLSDSLSKWKKPGLAINSSSLSDKSSFLHDQTDSSMYCDKVSSTENILKDLKAVDSTPVVLRKRKANEETIPFSASKKQAILQNMPQMSALGTPFTPVARKPPKNDYYDTPSIQFAEDSDMKFAATPGHQTPKSKLFSSQSATKVKRQSSSKSNCFSPKPQKSSRKGSFRKFLRRLSGSKESVQGPSPNNCSIDSSDSVASFGNTSGQKKKGTSFFRRRKKTPSSPARLVTSLPLELPRKASNASINSFLSSTENAIDMDKLDSKEIAASLQKDLAPAEGSKTFSIPNRRRSADGAVIGNTSLKRGKPNTVQTGLPYESLLSGSPNHNTSARNTIHKSSSHKEIFMSPERCERFECDPGAFDTSPIEKVESLDTCNVGLRKGGLDRQVSNASLNFEYSMALADQAVIIDDHEGSFLHDTSGVKEDGTEKIDTNKTSEETESKCETEKKMAASKETEPVEKGQVQEPQREINHITEEMLEELGPIPFCDEGSISCAKNHDVSTCTVQESETITLRKRAGNSRRCSAEPNLHVSADVHQILSRAGVVGEEKDKSCSSFVAVQNSSSSAPTPVKAFTIPDAQPPKPDLAAEKEIADRKASPLRFPNAAMRRGGASPVRIPTIFAKADREASKYRDLAKNIVKEVPRSNAKPSIPISTSLLRNMSVETGKKRVEGLRNKEESVTKENPKPVLSSMQMKLEKSAKQDENRPLNNIKPQNMDVKMSDLLERQGPICPQNLNKGLNTKLSEMSREKTTRHKGPMKPVKRLQGSPKSPKSPKRFHTSPNGPSKKPGRLSPLPTHVTDWNI